MFNIPPLGIKLWRKNKAPLRGAYRRGRIQTHDQGKAPATLALKVIIDHSTSLNHSSRGKTRIESIVEAAMTLHVVCLKLGVPHEVLVAPQALKTADLDSSERGKALIAGLVPALCGYEDMGLVIKTHAVPMAGYHQDIKLVLRLTDGACNDAESGKKVCHALKGTVEVIGILLDPDDLTRKYVAEMFGEDRVITCCSEELPQKLGNILRAIWGL
jgi:nitric oxide reductase activation protein